VIGALTMAVSYPIYLRYLGYERYGLWLVLSAVLAFAQLSSFGLGPAVAKLVAEDKARNRADGIAGYLGTAFWTLVVSGGAALVILASLRHEIAGLFALRGQAGIAAISLIPWVGILSLSALIGDLLSNTLSGVGRIDLANYTQAGTQLLGAVCSIVLLRLGYGVMSLLIGSGVACAALLAVSAMCILRIAQLQLWQLLSWDPRRFRRLARLGSGVAGGTLLSMMLSPFNRLILSRYGGLATIPIYDIAFSGGFRLRSLFDSGIRAIMPEISRVGAVRGDEARSRIEAINRRAYRVIFLAGAPVFLLAVLLAAPALHIWLGARYTAALPRAVQIALVGTFLSLLATPPYYTLLGLGKSNHVLGSHVSQSATNVAVVGIALVFSRSISVNTALWGGTAGMGVSLAYLTFHRNRTVAGWN
jgi:O-antigen/teichoic acid export membrane protein